MNALDNRLAVATDLARQAGDLAMRLRPPPGAAAGTLKGAQDWLTEADGAVEDFLSQRLAAAFPDDGFQGEETGRARAGRLRWVVDPIDGTSNYARGGPRFCVSLGLIEERTALLGVLVAPALGEVFAARQGGGATLNGAPIHVADTTDLARAQVEIGWSPRLPNQGFFELVERVMASGAMMRSGGSGAMGLADVAAGRLDAYVERHINLWDVAAALAILTEAGAVLSPVLDGIGPTHGNPILAAAPGVADALAVISGIHGTDTKLL
jgi:myo-inositol-1(or 4)-monophosphatase